MINGPPTRFIRRVDGLSLQGDGLITERNLAVENLARFMASLHRHAPEWTADTLNNSSITSRRRALSKSISAVAGSPNANVTIGRYGVPADFGDRAFLSPRGLRPRFLWGDAPTCERLPRVLRTLTLTARD